MSNPENWSPRDLAEMIQNGEIDALTELGLLNRDDADYIADYYDSYESIKGKTPPEDDDDEYYNMIRRASTQELNRAVDQGNISRIAYAVGTSRDEKNLKNWETVEIIKDLYRKDPKKTDLQNSVFQAIIFSSNVPPTGRGKSSYAYTNIEIAKTVHEDLKIKTNNPSDEFENIPHKFEKLKEWIETQEGEKLILLDEAKQFLMYDDYDAGKIISKLLALNRHNRTHMIIVGHTGADIPRDIRRQMYFVDKKTEKTAEIGYGLSDDDDERYEINNTLHEITDIPHTNLKYKSQGEKSINLKFDDDDDDDNNEKIEKIVGQLYDNGKTQKEIEEITDISQPQISRILSDS